MLWQNTVGPFLLQAAAGFASAVLLLGTVILLVGIVAKPRSRAGLGRRAAGHGDGAATCFIRLSGAGRQPDCRSCLRPVVVEAYINGEGRVYDFRIVSGPNDADTRSQVENLLVSAVL